MAESEIHLNVLDPVSRGHVQVHLLDPNDLWGDRCRSLVELEGPFAPIHLVPPLANTIRAYPDTELAQVLAQVEEGAVAVFFSPPDDWNDLAEQLSPELRTTHVAATTTRAAYHYAKRHPVFEKLPTQGLMGQPYRNVIPVKTFADRSDEDICGAFGFRGAPASGEASPAEPLWTTSILSRRFGTGRITFTHLRIMEHLGNDPLADQLFVNLVQHFARRSVPPGGPRPARQRAIEWLREERGSNLRRWMILGMFPNEGMSGHDTPYPPESEISLSGEYQGWYRPIGWLPCYAVAAQDHRIEMERALYPFGRLHPCMASGTAYAYAEVNSGGRGYLRTRFHTDNAAKVWGNGRLVFDSHQSNTTPAMAEEELVLHLQRGRNTILIKLSCVNTPCGFALHPESDPNKQPVLSWWK